MRSAVTGVSIVTTDGAGGRAGLTVSSMASVSAYPPMLLVCINRGSPLVPRIRMHGIFGVSVLAAHQAALAEVFAGRPPAGEPYDFTSGRWQAGGTGAPLLAGAAATFDCAVASTVEAGSHTIVIGDVLHAGRGSASPLAYTDGWYAAPGRLPRALLASV
jgi:flavin reductase (DIM6/NTAB) family NADH-FMN oxidoreductase RutF